MSGTIATVKAWFVDTAERVASTFVVTFLGLVTAAGTNLFSIATARAAAVAGIAAAFAVLKAAIGTLVGNETPSLTNVAATGAQWFRDMVERVVSTYGEAVLAFVTSASAGLLSIASWKAAVVAALPAAWSVVKAIIASRLGSKNSASLVKPKYPDTTIVA